MRPLDIANFETKLEIGVSTVRHYIHMQLGKPKNENLKSVPELALDVFLGNMKEELLELKGKL